MYDYVASMLASMYEIVTYAKNSLLRTTLALAFPLNLAQQPTKNHKHIPYSYPHPK